MTSIGPGGYGSWHVAAPVTPVLPWGLLLSSEAIGLGYSCIDDECNARPGDIRLNFSSGPSSQDGGDDSLEWAREEEILQMICVRCGRKSSPINRPVWIHPIKGKRRIYWHSWPISGLDIRALSNAVSRSP